ncbi:MAG: AAA family ATPase [Candidatus Thermoplasmatota archaeon]|nr:AAA family ATPase [Candidatus Thermoplasmatota archaeon]
MKIMAVCGMPGCGKGELADVARKMGVPVFSMGDVVRFHFQRDFPDRDPIETGIYADMERKKHGQDIWARRLTDQVETGIGSNAELVIIDGMRSLHERDLFRTQWGTEFLVLAIHSSPKTRFNRLRERGRGDDPFDRKAFDHRDERELGWGLGDIMALADMIIVNEGPLESLKEKARELLERVGGAG